MVLQFGGASGNGYLSVEGREAANAALNKKGEFKKGKFIYRDENGVQQEVDGSAACFEEATGRKLEFAPPRYDDVVIMDPSAYAGSRKALRADLLSGWPALPNAARASGSSDWIRAPSMEAASIRRLRSCFSRRGKLPSTTRSMDRSRLLNSRRTRDRSVFGRSSRPNSSAWCCTSSERKRLAERAKPWGARPNRSTDDRAIPGAVRNESQECPILDAIAKTPVEGPRIAPVLQLHRREVGGG